MSRDRLDDEEQRIEDSAEEFVPVSEEERDGVPYQTLVSSVLHKLVTGQLVDEAQIMKAVELVERSNTKR